MTYQEFLAVKEVFEEKAIKIAGMISSCPQYALPYVEWDTVDEKEVSVYYNDRHYEWSGGASFPARLMDADDETIKAFVDALHEQRRREDAERAMKERASQLAHRRRLYDQLKTEFE